MRSSFPVPHIKTNLNYDIRKKFSGFINDSSCTNPSDPSSMQTNPIQNYNSICNIKVVNLPDGKSLVEGTK